MRSYLSWSASVAGAILVMVLSGPTTAWAGVPTVPEIDGSAVSAGLAALAAGVLIVRARRG